MGSEQSCHKRRVPLETQPRLKKARVDRGYHSSVEPCHTISIGSIESLKLGSSTEDIQTPEDRSNSMESTDVHSLIPGSPTPTEELRSPNGPNAHSNSMENIDDISLPPESPISLSSTPETSTRDLSTEQRSQLSPNARPSSMVSFDDVSLPLESPISDLSTEEEQIPNGHSNRMINNEQVLELLHLLSAKCEIGFPPRPTSATIGPAVSPGSLFEQFYTPNCHSNHSNAEMMSNDAVEQLLDLLRVLTVNCEFEQLKSENNVLLEENIMFKNKIDIMRKELTNSLSLSEKNELNRRLENMYEDMRNKTMETVAAKERLSVQMLQMNTNNIQMNRKLSDIICEQRKLFKQTSLIMQKELCAQNQTNDERRNSIRNLRKTISELTAEKESQPLQMRVRYDRIIGELGNIIGQQRKLIKQSQSTSTS